MAAVKKLDGYAGNDIELCRTTSSKAGNQTAQLLVEERIPFTKNRKRIPFFNRDKYAGASEVWVIRINPSRYGQARRALDNLEYGCRNRLILSNY